MRCPNFVLDIEGQRLWQDDEAVHISKKAFQLLRCFVENPGRLLTKEWILEEVWGEVWVSDGLVKEYVHDLRAALGDDARDSRFIETVRGRGYRLIGGIEIAKAGTGQAATTYARPPSLIVRVLSDLTSSESSARLCRGLTSDLITDLARFPDLVVLADDSSDDDAKVRPSVPEESLKGGLSYILTGSVQIADRKFRVNVHLIEVVGGRVIWTEQYDRRLENLLDVQRNIVARVVSAVGGVSGRIPRTERLRVERYLPNDLKAYDLYLLAHELEVHFDRDKTLRAIDLVKHALELEPEFARGWLVLGWLSWQAAAAEWVEDVSHQQQTVIDAYAKAAELDPLDPFALMEFASVQAIRGDCTGAKDALERALDLGRNQADLLVAASNYVAFVLGEPERATGLMDRGLEMLLQIPAWHNLTGLRVSYFSGDYERAVEFAERAPKFLLTDLFEILSLAQLGHQDILADRRRAFGRHYPNFDHLALCKLLPITSDQPMKSYLDGIAKAGLGRDVDRLRVVS